MNVVIFSQSNYILDSLVTLLIPSGITPYAGESDEDITRKIEYLHIDVLLVEFNRENFEMALKTIGRIRNSPLEKLKRCAIVLYIEGVSKEFVARGLAAGAVGFIEKSTSHQEIINTLMNACKRITGGIPPRRYERIILDPGVTPENVGVKFVSPKTGQSILGVIRDISIVGMAVELKGTYNSTCIDKGMIIDGIRFILLGRELVVDVLLAAYQSHMAAMLFNNLSEEDRREISLYIFRKLSNLI